jgi:hypothetical protein
MVGIALPPCRRAQDRHFRFHHDAQAIKGEGMTHPALALTLSAIIGASLGFLALQVIIGVLR